MNAKQTALDAYLARVTAIHIKLARLRQLAKERFGHDPESIHWGHVGDLGRVDQALDDLLQRGWIEPADGGYLQIDAGYAAIGQLLPVPLDDVQPVDASDDLQRISPAAATAAPDGSARGKIILRILLEHHHFFLLERNGFPRLVKCLVRLVLGRHFLGSDAYGIQR